MPHTLVKRIESVEVRMSTLEQLPARVDAVESQISRLRTEVRDGFSAIRCEMNDLGDDLGRQMRILYEDQIQRLKLLYEGRDPSQPPFPDIGKK